MVERLLCKQDAAGSSPAVSTKPPVAPSLLRSSSHVEIDFPHYDLLLSDNYFEITESDKLLIVAEIHEPDPATRAATLSDHLPTAEELQQDMTLRSVYDIGRN